MSRGSVFAAMRFARSQLSRRDALKLRLGMFLSAIVSVLDMLGVLLLSAVGVLLLNLVAPSDAATRRPLTIGSLSVEASGGWLAAIVCLAVVLLAAKSLLAWLTNRRILRFIARREVDFGARLFDRYLAAPYATVVGMTTQGVIAAVTTGSGACAALLAQNAALVGELVLIMGLSLLLLLASPLLFVFTLTYFSLLTLVISKVVGHRSQRTAANAITASIAANQSASEIVGLAREVRVYRLASRLGAKFRSDQERSALANASRESWNQVPRYALETALLVGIALAAGLVVLTQPPDRAVLSLGLYLASSTRLLPSVQRINGAWAAAKTAVGNLAGAQLLLDLPDDDNGDRDRVAQGERSVPDRDYKSSPREVPSTGTSQIRFRDASFRYPHAERTALQGVDLLLPLGSRVAVVGHSGAGKSTFGDLLLGLLHPTTGQVELVTKSSAGADRVRDVGELTTAFVSQDVYLAPTTIRSNVALSVAGQDVDDNAVWTALDLAQMDAFVRTLPDGLDTLLGERGARLSGGQRQRLGLARALFREPDLLLLDEATSSLDAHTEQSVTEALATISRDITVVMIAHRLATVRSADIVVYLSDGKLVDAGRFEELTARHRDLADAAELQGVGG